MMMMLTGQFYPTHLQKTWPKTLKLCILGKVNSQQEIEANFRVKFTVDHQRQKGLYTSQWK